MIDQRLLRLLDANANRAREGIRTAEDYLRFGGTDSAWAARLKAARNGLTRALTGIFTTEQLARSRDAAQDPLRAETHYDAATQPGAQAVAHRGLKRAQEAVRVLEEYLRGEHPQTAAVLARLRFELYEAEQWLICCSSAARILNLAQVYVLLTESVCTQALLTTARAVLKGGARILQVREKQKSDQRLLADTRALVEMCGAAGALLFVNDRTDIALAAGAAGVHLGQTDISPEEARQLSAHRLLIGRSTHCLEQVRLAAEREQADYIAIGAMYPTETKPDHQLAGLHLARQVDALGLALPVFAIGGLSLARLQDVKAAGVRRVAVSAAILSTPDPEAATRQFVEAMAG